MIIDKEIIIEDKKEERKLDIGDIVVDINNNNIYVVGIKYNYNIEEYIYGLRNLLIADEEAAGCWIKESRKLEELRDKIYKGETFKVYLADKYKMIIKIEKK